MAKTPFQHRSRLRAFWPSWRTCTEHAAGRRVNGQVIRPPAINLSSYFAPDRDRGRYAVSAGIRMQWIMVHLIADLILLHDRTHITEDTIGYVL